MGLAEIKRADAQKVVIDPERGQGENLGRGQAHEHESRKQNVVLNQNQDAVHVVVQLIVDTGKGHCVANETNRFT